MSPRKLIEVAFPLEEVSAHSRREKNIRWGHISTLHVWWARRPLAACRAFIYASLINDPHNEEERTALLKEVADLASWNAVRKPDDVVRSEAQGGSGLTGRQLLERAERRIREAYGGVPRLRDPFAGGGAIPLEAIRLGCEVDACDLNPVAVLLLKATVSYPQQFGRPLGEQVRRKKDGPDSAIAGVHGQVPEYIRVASKRAQSSFAESDAAAAYERNPLAADVRHWGQWIFDRARSLLAEFYPGAKDGEMPIAYLWSRTLPCPSCGAEMPLLRQYWLVRRGENKQALVPVLDPAQRSIRFEVLQGDEIQGDPAEATTTGGDTRCLHCRQVTKAGDVRQAAKDGKLGDAMTAVVRWGDGKTGKAYRPVSREDREAFARSRAALQQMARDYDGELPLVPDEPIAPDTLGLRIDQLGFEHWGQLFNDRQLLVLLTFVNAFKEVAKELPTYGLEPEYVTAILSYLGLTVDRLALRNSNQCIWHSGRETIENEISRGVLPPVWDYAEAVAIGDATGSWQTSLDSLCRVIDEISIAARPALVRQQDATRATDWDADLVITDPPYYAAVDYAGLSDFFYVWLKRALGDVHPDLFTLPLTPKRQQAIMASESGKPEARARYVELMQSAFFATRQGLTGVAFASIDPDAWATLIESLLAADLVPQASWPIDTEMESGMVKIGQARLKTSVWMACRPREAGAQQAFLSDVLDEMRPTIRERLLYFWGQGIRGADFFISAIGPGLSVFGQHPRVLRPDGTEVSVREFLDMVRRESTQVALEQVLHGADLGLVDPLSRQYITWLWSYSRAPLESGEAIALCLATGAEYRELVRPRSFAVEVKEGSKKLVKLLSIRERLQANEDLGVDSPARPSPLVDRLHRAARLWGSNESDRLLEYRADMGEPHWAALRTLGQAASECLPSSDEDRRLIRGLLSSGVMNLTPPESVTSRRRDAEKAVMARLPGFE